MDRFVLPVADCVFELQCLYGRMRKLACKYAVDALEPDCAPDAVLCTTQEDITYERSQCQDAEYSDSYLETLVMLRKLATWGPRHGFLLMHGAVITYGGKAYMFTAPSGTGKSTHIKLWQDHLGTDVQVLNGDKPFIRVGKNGSVTAYGTPWCGKEGWSTPGSAPLAGIVVLNRGTENTCQPVEPWTVLDQLIQQIYVPPQAEDASAALGLFDGVLTTVPVFSLYCDISQAAVQASYQALTGKPWPEEMGEHAS